jgi:hypothetical protein
MFLRLFIFLPQDLGLPTSVPGSSLFQILSGDHYGGERTQAKQVRMHVSAMDETWGYLPCLLKFNAKWVLSKQKKKQQPSGFRPC